MRRKAGVSARVLTQCIGEMRCHFFFHAALFGDILSLYRKTFHGPGMFLITHVVQASFLLSRKKTVCFFIFKFIHIFPQLHLLTYFIYNYFFFFFFVMWVLCDRDRCSMPRQVPPRLSVFMCNRVWMWENKEQPENGKRMSALSLVLEYFYPRCVFPETKAKQQTL